jgi:hypothetical protein
MRGYFYLYNKKKGVTFFSLFPCHHTSKHRQEDRLPTSLMWGELLLRLQECLGVSTRLTQLPSEQKLGLHLEKWVQSSIPTQKLE